MLARPLRPSRAASSGTTITSTISLEHAGEVGDALAFAEADVVAEHDAAAAEVRHARLEADPRPQRLLLEQAGPAFGPAAAARAALGRISS